jgi:naphthalene 1,2-dioxygenase system ferredoxin subunit
MTEMHWQKAMSLEQLESAGGITGCVVDSRKLAIFSISGQIFVTADLCTHGGARLSEGYLEGYEIECPLHQGRFDVRTGVVTAAPCVRPVRTYRARVNRDSVEVELPVRETGKT